MELYSSIFEVIEELNFFKSARNAHSVLKGNIKYDNIFIQILLEYVFVTCKHIP